MNFNRLVKSAVSVFGAVTMMYAASVAAADGKAVFESTCKLCHGAGIGGAPKFGDKAAWGVRIAKGLPTLEDHAINGFKGKGFMPPKGGKASLSNDEVKAAVTYMVEAAK